MKTKLILVLTLAVAAGAYAQGYIKFANGSSTALRFHDDPIFGGPFHGQKVAPGTDFVVGLYLAQGFGRFEDQLQLYKTTTIATPATSPTHALAGYFNGGSPLIVNPPWLTGQEITFQIKVWPRGYASMEELIANPISGAFTGQSTLGSYRLADVGIPVTDIFGTGWGQVAPVRVGTFPEPAPAALLGLGLLLALVCQRRNPAPA